MDESPSIAQPPAHDAPPADAQATRWTRHIRRAQVAAKVSGVVALLAASAVVATHPEARALLEHDHAQAALARAGVWAPLVFAAVFALSIILAIPATPLTLLGASLFAPATAYAVLLGGALLGALISFGIGRVIGRASVEALFKSASEDTLLARLASLDAAITTRGLLIVTGVRLSHIPYPLASYALALTGVRLRDYLLGTLLGSAPLVFVFVFLGDTLRRAWATGDWTALLGWRLAAAITLLAASLLGARVIQRRRA